MSKSTLRNLRGFHCSRKLEHAVVSYIVNYLTKYQNDKQLRETFLQLDKDNDGVLSKTDLCQGLSNYFGSKGKLINVIFS